MEVPKQQQKAPFAMVVGNHKSPKQTFLVMDGKVVCEIPVNDVPIFLLAAYYTFNICYPVGCHNLFCFLEIVLLKLEEPNITVTASVKNFLARLK